MQASVKGLWGNAAATRCERVSFDVIGMRGKCRVEHALSVHDLDLPSQSLADEITERIENIEHVQIKPYASARTVVLLGQDNWELKTPVESRPIKNSGLVISRGKLGWTVHGYVETGRRQLVGLNVEHPDDESNVTSLNEEERLRELERVINEFFNLENMGVANLKLKSNRQEHAEKILRETTRKVGKRWETGLLWKNEEPPRVNSRATALKRLILLEKRFQRDPQFAELYYREFDRFITNGYAVKIGSEVQRSRVWYIPHFGVQNINKPGKVRFVLDAAAKTSGTSLNDQLDAGPDLLQSLVGVLLRYRQFGIAAIGDIKDMFLRVGMIDEDRGSQRILFRKNPEDNIEEYEMNVLIFGSKCSPCSAIFVKNKNAERFKRVKPDAVNSIVNNFYMDDLLVSKRTVQEMQDLILDIILINSTADFPMHGWASNDSRAVEHVAEDRKLDSNAKANLCNEEDRILGLYRDRTLDTLSFNVGLKKIHPDLLIGKKKPTKREVFSIVMSVYDPLGILAPFILNAKILMQYIWRSGVQWDKPIRDEEFKIWSIWLSNLPKIRECKIPRSYIPRGEEYVNTQLHIFCDASFEAYSAVAYLRTLSNNGKVFISLIMSKTRVKPIKPMTIPRLELQAALLSSRLAAIIQKELEVRIDERVFWSDSTTVLHWIKSEPHTKQIFVANRLGEIAESTRITEWRWVPTDLNPADDATRASDRALTSNDRWFAGPEFLSDDPSTWPRQKSLERSEIKEYDNLESQKQFIYATSINIIEIPTAIKLLGWNGLLAAAMRLRSRVHCWVGRWRRAGERKGLKGNNWADHWKMPPKERDPRENLVEAAKFWYREIQSASFPNEVQALKTGKEVPKGSKLRGLKPYIDDEGVLRAEGRVTKIQDCRFENHPILLDAAHFATKLLIASHHRQFKHANNETIVNELRQEFYIIGLRTRLRWIAKQCIVCRLERARPQNPPMADLPRSRVAYKFRPFTHCGIDYFGPVFVKIGRRREKRWGVLFTCMTTRAIHLELAYTLDASSTIMALRRLGSRRGFPVAVYSDNGTNFTKASKELREAILDIETDKQREFAKTKRFTWRFNPPGAPHMGGAWERLIRSVKTALFHTLDDQAPTEEVLLTVLLEVEHMVNSRPLTHVSVDPRDEEALTPNHFLIGSSSGNLRLEKYETEMFTPRKRFELAQHFAERFWKRWLKEYLPTLLPRRKWHDTPPSLGVGDVVIIVDDQAPRNVWRKGKISQLCPGPDGIARVAKVNSGKSEFVRPVNKLVRICGTKGVENL